MGSSTLLQGVCGVWKEGEHLRDIALSFVYDSDSDSFKGYSKDKLWTEFRPSQVTGMSVYSSQEVMQGSVQAVPVVVKVYHLGLYVAYPPEGTWIYVYNFSDESVAESCKAALQRCLPQNEVLVLLKTRERVPLQEVADVLARRHFPSTIDDAKKMVETHIMSGKLDGVIDAGSYVSKTALQRETVRYDVVTKFEIGKNGVLVLTCPKCGASLPVESKDGAGKCSFCGSTFTVPKRILDLL